MYCCMYSFTAEEDLFGANPQEEEEDSPFSHGVGLFAGRGGLFDQDDEEVTMQ